MWLFARRALEHGVDPEDITHAIRNARRRVELDDGRILFIGADRAGRLLEVVVVDLDTDSPTVIHAMALRRKFYRHL